MSETAPPITYDLSLLEQSRAKWQSSPALRAVYHHLLTQMAAVARPGPALELGSGIGMAKEVMPEWVTSDLVATPYVDRAVSAYAIPAEGWASIMALDTLHHLQRPFDFLASAAAALRPGGRVIMMEPAGTPWGRRFYGTFHHEPCDPAEVVPPFEFAADAQGEFANMGMGVGLFCHQAAETERRLAERGLRLVKVTFRDVVAYPLTGGFSRGALMPAPVLRALLALEGCLSQGVLRRVGLRMLIVLEKTERGGQ